jgi:hypothetical protein
MQQYGLTKCEDSNIQPLNMCLLVLTETMEPKPTLFTSQQMYVYYKLFIAVCFNEILV